MANLATAVPGGTRTFRGFSDLSLITTPIRLSAFIGSGASGQQGLYLSDVSNPQTPTDPCKVADLTTAIPGGTGTFTGFSAVSTSLAHTAFLGQGANGQAGIYLASALTKVIAVGDMLEGKVITALHLGRNGLDGDRLAFAATFADGSQGVYAPSRSALQFPGKLLPSATPRLVSLFGQCQQLLDLGPELGLDLIGAAGTVPAGAGVQLGAVQADRAEAADRVLPRHLQDLHKGRFEFLAKARQGVVVGMLIGAG